MVPPTAKQIQDPGRPQKHLYFWRGPCEVVEKLSETAYAVNELSTNPRFERTAINLSRFRAVTIAEPPPYDPFAADPFEPNELVAVRDNPTSRFYLARTLATTNSSISVQYLGCRSANINTAVFRRCWSHAATATITLSHSHPASCSPWTGDLDIDDLDELLVARNLELTHTYRLTADSARQLAAVVDEQYVFSN